MLDKYRVLRNAEHLVVNRKFPQAIREYERLLENEPEDPRLLNTLGDLHLKAGQEEQALRLFERVAKIYSRGGFTNKAIAMYRKIHLLNREDEKVNEVLADLYLRQGLLQDGLRHLSLLLERFQGLLKFEEAVTVARRIFEVGGGKVEHGLQLARLLDRQGDKEAAVESFLQLLQKLVQEERFETAREVALEALSLYDGHLDLIRVFAETSQYCGRREEAERYLQGRIESTGSPFPYRIFQAWLKEVNGEIPEAAALYRELQAEGHQNRLILDGLRRTDPRTPIGADSPVDSRAPEPSSSDSLEIFDFDSQQDADPLGSPVAFEPSDAGGENEELAVADLFSTGVEKDGAGDGEPVEEQDYFRLALEDGDGPVEASSSGAAETDSDSDAFRFEPSDSAPFDSDQGADDSLALFADTETESPVSSFDEPPEEVVEVALPPLEEALQEADFYVKLGFKEEADRYLKALYRAYPEDERVLKRVRRFFPVLPDLKVETAPNESVRPTPADGDFEQEIDSAFSSIFQDAPSEEGEEILRYDVVSSERDGPSGPEVHYDLGLAYKEMGLIEDAVQEFLSSVELLESPQGDPLKLLCCSMLANCFLQLENLEEALRWARVGMDIPDKKDYEWKAIRYDLSCVHEERGEIDPALEGYREILAQDANYRDVKARVERLAQMENVR